MWNNTNLDIYRISQWIYTWRTICCALRWLNINRFYTDVLRLLHLHCDNVTVPLEQPRGMWEDTSWWYNHNTTTHNTTVTVPLEQPRGMWANTSWWYNHKTTTHNTTVCTFNSLRPRRNEQHWADDIFKRIFFNENVWISIKISLKFVPKGPINNIAALVQIMAWRRSGDKPLSEPMMVSLPTHICVTRPQWVNWIYCVYG